MSDGDPAPVTVGRADDATEVSAPLGDALALPDGATDSEAAAIVAAVGAHLADLDGGGVTDDAAETGWDGDRWSFAGRTAAVAGRPVRPTDGTPTDPWTAAGRGDRL